MSTHTLKLRKASTTRSYQRDCLTLLSHKLIKDYKDAEFVSLAKHRLCDAYLAAASLYCSQLHFVIFETITKRLKEFNKIIFTDFRTL